MQEIAGSDTAFQLFQNTKTLSCSFSDTDTQKANTSMLERCRQRSTTTKFRGTISHRRSDADLKRSLPYSSWSHHFIARITTFASLQEWQHSLHRKNVNIRFIARMKWQHSLPCSHEADTRREETDHISNSRHPKLRNDTKPFWSSSHHVHVLEEKNMKVHNKMLTLPHSESWSSLTAYSSTTFSILPFSSKPEACWRSFKIARPALSLLLFSARSNAESCHARATVRILLLFSSVESHVLLFASRPDARSCYAQPTARIFLVALSVESHAPRLFLFSSGPDAHSCQTLTAKKAARYKKQNKYFLQNPH